jgi:hypothetical protein
VVSAASAAEYLHFQWQGVSMEWVAVGILAFFAMLIVINNHNIFFLFI